MTIISAVRTALRKLASNGQAKQNQLKKHRRFSDIPRTSSPCIPFIEM